MTTSTDEDATRPLTVEQAAGVLNLAKRSDSVEIKLMAPVAAHRATIERLGLDPVEAQPRQAFFFDTPELALNQAGLIVRARRIQGGRADTVIKLRPVDPAMIDADLRRSAGFKIEVDVMPGGYVCSASFRGACTAQDVLDAASGAAPLKSLFSREQRAFFKEHAPPGVKWSSLVTLGPTFLLKAKHLPRDFRRELVAEVWFYPDGSRLLEVSTKCLPAEAFQVAAEFKAFLVNCGIAITAGPGTKTISALEFFSAHLPAAADADRRDRKQETRDKKEKTRAET